MGWVIFLRPDGVFKAQERKRSYRSSAAAKVFLIPEFSFQGSDSIPGMILAKQRPKFPTALSEPLAKPLLEHRARSQKGIKPPTLPPRRCLRRMAQKPGLPVAAHPFEADGIIASARIGSQGQEPTIRLLRAIEAKPCGPTLPLRTLKRSGSLVLQSRWPIRPSAHFSWALPGSPD